VNHDSSTLVSLTRAGIHPTDAARTAVSCRISETVMPDDRPTSCSVPCSRRMAKTVVKHPSQDWRMPLTGASKDLIRAIVAAYDNAAVRMYSRARFVILRQRFIEEIGQYLPSHGAVLDVGCGFGLFSLCFAGSNPDIHIHGLDLDPWRIAMAQRAAVKLGICNVSFAVADVCDVKWPDGLCGIYMLDLIHHIPRESVRPLLSRLTGQLAVGGRLVVKDVDVSPSYKRAFTWLLDKGMSPRAAVRYWPQREVVALLKSLNLTVYKHAMVDYLPYPHMIYIGHEITPPL
jgi:ubiquinone/menaquinone biosynthesis C-methylase UbiE